MSRGTPATTGIEALRLTAGALATWRVAHLLAAEDGPGAVVARVRRRLGDGPLGGLMDCFGCVSVWVAAPVALLVRPRRVGLALGAVALSGAAFLLERATDRGTPVLDLTPYTHDDHEGAQP